eukprot:NODE_2690_length_893_cov_390.967780.p1 GENE.NODE_2690_length_893_cov_390.967780~~NODE_2690_length_893_cov_390.967780.p1  ORF type:complete len:268 (-),score=67.97 NODE_2690_length_893_cov_390.967780:54-857(-)
MCRVHGGSSNFGSSLDSTPAQGCNTNGAFGSSEGPFLVRSRRAMAEMMMVVVSHSVPAFGPWFEKFTTEEAVARRKELGIVRTICGDGPLDASGKPTILVINTFPKSREVECRAMYELTGPPFVGGADLIKEGFVILPAFAIYASLPFDQAQVRAPAGEEMMAIIASHAVPSFDAWFAKFKEVDRDGMHTDLGIAHTLTGQGPPDANGNPTCLVVHTFPKSQETTCRAMFDFTGPPFVGGEDLIEKGIVIPPFTTTYATVRLDKMQQ